MKIAVPYENGEVFQHFGHATQFMLYTAEDGKPLAHELLSLDDPAHEAVAGLLHARGVELVICGGIGDGARQALEQAHLLLCSGVSGGADEAVKRFLNGELDYSTGTTCDHHHEEGEEHACGGCCGGCHGGCHEEEELSPLAPYAETRTFTDIVALTAENFGDEVYNDPALILIDFWAEWCGPCRMLAPTFEALNAEYPHVKFCRVNCDEEPQLAAMFGVSSIPTLAVVRERRTLTGMVGAHAADDIRAMLEECLA